MVVTIAGNNASAVYDGTEHKVTGYKVTAISNELYKEGDFELQRNSGGEAYGSRNDLYGSDSRAFYRTKMKTSVK